MNKYRFGISYFDGQAWKFRTRISEVEAMEEASIQASSGNQYELFTLFSENGTVERRVVFKHD